MYKTCIHMYNYVRTIPPYTIYTLPPQSQNSPLLVSNPECPLSAHTSLLFFFPFLFFSSSTTHVLVCHAQPFFAYTYMYMYMYVNSCIALNSPQLFTKQCICSCIVLNSPPCSSRRGDAGSGYLSGGPPVPPLCSRPLSEQPQPSTPHL